MARQFFSGNSIEQALMAAARHYGTEPERVAYKQREKKHGFVNTRRRVVIEVDPDSPTKDPAQLETEQASTTEFVEKLSGNALRRADRPESRRGHDDRPRSESRERSSSRDSESPSSDRGHSDQDRGRGGRGSSDRRDDRGGRSHRRGGGRDRRDVETHEHYWQEIDWENMEIEDGISREMAAFELGIEKILDVMDLDIEYSLVEGETFEVNFSGEDEEALTDDDGRALEAVEHILPRVVRNLLGRSIPCRVDCAGFRAEHEQELMDLAKRVSEEVLDSGESALLDPMTPADRRIVHLALVDSPGIDTSSEGGGYMKRVRIVPAR